MPYSVEFGVIAHQPSTAGWLCCNLSKTRHKLVAMKFGASFIAPLNTVVQNPIMA